jgi:hypothetical protein
VLASVEHLTTSEYAVSNGISDRCKLAAVDFGTPHADGENAT